MYRWSHDILQNVYRWSHDILQNVYRWSHDILHALYVVSNVGTFRLIQFISAVIHTENVARGANWEFPKCKGGELYTMY